MRPPGIPPDGSGHYYLSAYDEGGMRFWVWCRMSPVITFDGFELCAYHFDECFRDHVNALREMEIMT